MKPRLPLINRGGKKNPEKKSTRRLGVDLHRAGLAVGTIVILSVLLSIHMLPSKVSLKLYDTAPESIYAHRTARYRDTAETERRRELAANGVVKVYDPVPSALSQATSALKMVFRTAEDISLDQNEPTGADKAVRLRERLGSMLGAQVSDATYVALAGMDVATLRDTEKQCQELITSAMSKGVREDPVDVRAARKLVLAQAKRKIEDAGRAEAAGEIAQALLRPNQVYNEQRTLAEQEKARNAVQPSHNSMMRGELVIGKGDTVLEEHIEKFEALGLRNPKLDYQSVISVTLFVLAVVMLVTAYLRIYHPDIAANTRTLMLLALLVIASTFALRVGGSMLGIKLTTDQVGYLGILWVVTAGMIVSVMVNPQVSVLITALLSIVLSMLLNSELRFAASALLTALVGIYSVANIRDRHDLMRVGGALAAMGVLLVWVMGGMANDPVRDMLAGSLWAGLVIPLAAVSMFFFGTVPLERPFGRTTHISLLELADTNKPLLKRLVMEASGTFTHSMAVGYLAETAAEAIGADSLIARVASYYHDIGKIRRPHFFIENQCVENIHDRMNPTLSTLVITSHIKDGIEVAREFKLPRTVLDIIAQHHGTSLVQYFYNQFADEHDPSTALEQQFRYSGPKPQTKEAAIVMLADSVEAASRSMVKPTPAKIELLVNRVVADKLRDGQLDECELTFKELSKITSSFVKALIGTMHARIEYPDAISAEGRRLIANAGSDSESTRETGEPPADEEPSSAAATN